MPPSDHPNVLQGARFVLCLRSGYALVPFGFAPRSPSRSCTVHGVPIPVAAQSFAEPSSRQRDRRKGPGRYSLHEELSTISEVGRYRTSRIDSMPGPILINETNRHVSNAMFETPDGEGEPAERVLT